MNNYIINLNTIVLIPNYDTTKVIEKYNTFEVNKKTIDIINESCLFYGSSFLGRCNSTYYLIGVKYKCPIIISEIKKMIFFPTSSYKINTCIWINYNEILDYKTNNNLTTINFKNNKNITINISSRVLNNQIFKSSRLDSIFQRKS